MRHSRLGPRLRRVVVYTHRWCGIAFGALFIGWFVSGVVLMYVGMPRLAPGERLARRPALDFAAARLTPEAASQRVRGSVDGLDLTMVDGRPVYRFRARSSVSAIYADSGEPVGPITSALAVGEARAFAPEAAKTIRYDRRLTAPDQWTLQLTRQLPLHRVALGDRADAHLYISEGSGDILLETTTTSRRWAYPGAIVHWIYLTPIRRHAAAWAQFIIWTSVAGTLMVLVGLLWGLWRFSPRAIYRLRRVASHSPYARWMWWHHYAGLVFGLATLTWIFSGLLSMDPWDWHPSTTPHADQRRAFAGTTFRLDGVSIDDLQRALNRLGHPREALITLFHGQRWLATDRGTASLDNGAATLPLDEHTVMSLAAAAMPKAHVTELTRLTDYDAYYYDRARELPLPVFRIRYDDPARTWLYVDAGRGTVLRKEERLTRLNRWLYHGLHSFDFPFLYYRRPLWDIIVIVLSAGGLGLSLAAVSPAWHRLRRHLRRRPRWVSGSES
jgi:hypothetical protein